MSEKEIIMNYLNELALTDDAIKNALTNKDKSVDKMMNYLCERAKEQAGENARSCCVDSDTVFMWARHYWLEKIASDKDNNVDEEQDYDSDEEAEKIKKRFDNRAKRYEKMYGKKDEKEPHNEQLSLFDFGE